MHPEEFSGLSTSNATVVSRGNQEKARYSGTWALSFTVQIPASPHSIERVALARRSTSWGCSSKHLNMLIASTSARPNRFSRVPSLSLSLSTPRLTMQVRHNTRARSFPEVHIYLTCRAVLPAMNGLVKNLSCLCASHILILRSNIYPVPSISTRTSLLWFPAHFSRNVFLSCIGGCKRSSLLAPSSCLVSPQ